MALTTNLALTGVALAAAGFYLGSQPQTRTLSSVLPGESAPPVRLDTAGAKLIPVAPSGQPKTPSPLSPVAFEPRHPPSDPASLVRSMPGILPNRLADKSGGGGQTWSAPPLRYNAEAGRVELRAD